MTSTLALLALADSDWGTGDESLVLRIVHVAAPLVLFGLFAWIVARSIRAQRRYKAVDVLSESDLAELHAAVTSAEERTVGEIVPVVVEESDSHPQAIWKAAFVTGIVGTALLAAWFDLRSPVFLIGGQLVFGLIGYAMAWMLPDFRRTFVTEERATEMAEEQALQEFHGLNLRDTEARTGVLIFVSLFEHRVVVLGDEGINAVVEPDLWVRVDEKIVAAVRAGRLRDGLLDGIHASAEVLEEHFPWTDGDRNEIPDRVIVRAK